MRKDITDNLKLASLRIKKASSLIWEGYSSKAVIAELDLALLAISRLSSADDPDAVRPTAYKPLNPENAMTNKFTADSTVIAAAHNFCIAEAREGRDGGFTTLAAGAHTTFRQRRLFESAMLEWQTRGKPHQAAVNRMAAKNVERFRFERYGKV